MKKALSISLFVSLIFLSTSSFAASVKSQVQAAYKTWVKTVTSANGNPDNILKLYTPHAILLPTLDPKVLISHKKMKAYFVKFSGLKDLSATTHQLVTQVFPGFAINSAHYTFHYVGKDGKRVNVHARFNMVYRKINGKWLIVNMHSSVLPK